jgi:tape measure domain-containing protein
MATSKLDIVIQAQDQASRVLSAIGRQTSDLQKSVTDLGQANATTGTKVQGMTTAFFKAGLALEAVRIAANAVGAAISTAFDIGKDVFASAAAFEQSAIAFEVMLGSADRARKLLQDVSVFARKTPFELPELVDTTKRLLAYNIAAEDIIPTLTALGNVTAGIGREKMPQLILAYGQVRAATRLTGMELRQFTEAGVPLIEQLARQFGVAESQIMEMVSAGEIGFPAVQQAFQEMSAEGGKFYNLMERQSTTFDGVVSNLRDNFMGMGREIIGISQDGTVREGSIFHTLSLRAQDLLKWVDANRAGIERFGRQLFDSLVAMFNQNVLPVLQRFGDWLTNPKYAEERQQWVNKMGDFARNVGAVASAGASLVGWIASAIGWFDALYTKIKPVTDLLGKISAFSPPNIINGLLTGQLPGLNQIRQMGKQLRLPGFAMGGFTGRGAANDVAGLVHKGEYVLPQQAVDQATGLPKSGAGGFSIGSLTIVNNTPGSTSSIMADLGWEISRRLA